MRTLLDGTLVQCDPCRAVTFVQNHDTQDGQALQSVIAPWFQPIAYAVILLRPQGYPCIFYGDYYGVPSHGQPARGAVLDIMSDQELSQVCERASVFAKLSPAQKARVVTLLRQNGHSVGYMGDGINDAAAMKASDVGISVDTAVDIAKESASVVLLEKDLLVLEEGILEGRRTYANMIKYIKMTASSNFGNMLSVLAASAFLPFLPMASVQLILLNMIYDFSCTLIPWDNVDAEYLKKPRQWSANSITRFMSAEYISAVVLEAVINVTK